MAAGGGVVLLVPNTTPFTSTGDLAGNPGLIDMVGYGIAAGSFETVAHRSSDLGNPVRQRDAAGSDSDHNANDFSELTPTPKTATASPPPSRSPRSTPKAAPRARPTTTTSSRSSTPARSAVPQAGLSLQYRAPGATGRRRSWPPSAGPWAAAPTTCPAGPAVRTAPPCPASTTPRPARPARPPAARCSSSRAHAPSTRHRRTSRRPATSPTSSAGVPATSSRTPLPTSPTLIRDESLTRPRGRRHRRQRRRLHDRHRRTQRCSRRSRSRPSPRSRAPARPRRSRTRWWRHGVVTASYPSGTGNLRASTCRPRAPTPPDASDGIFVFTGSQSLSPAPTVGDAVTVRGRITSSLGMTEMTLSSPGWQLPSTAARRAPVVAEDVLPGTDCALPGTGCLTGAALEAAREKDEGEVFLPTAPTPSATPTTAPLDPVSSRVRDGGRDRPRRQRHPPLIVPTESSTRPADPAGLAARKAYNDAHMIILDDGADHRLHRQPRRGHAVPVVHPDQPVRIGAAVTSPSR